MTNVRVRVKNKYIVVLALLLLVSIGLVRASGGEIIYNQARSASEAGDKALALAYYDKMIQNYPEHEKVPDALFWSAALLPQPGDFQAVFFSRHSSISRVESRIEELPQDALTREERLWLLYNEFREHPLTSHALFQLAETLYAANDPQAETLLLEALREGARPADAALRLVSLYTTAGQFEQALDIIAYSQSAFPAHLTEEIKLAQGDVFAAMGNVEAATVAYESVLGIVRERMDQWSDAREVDRATNLEHYQRLVDERLERLRRLPEDGVTGSVVATVTWDGKPLAGVEVILNPVDPHRFLGFNPESNFISASTDLDGAVILHALAGREYEVGIRLDYELMQQVEGYHLQIKNGVLELVGDTEVDVQFHFVPTVQATVRRGEAGLMPMTVTWEPYAGAAFYSVQLRSITYWDKGYSVGQGPSATNIIGSEYLLTTMPPQPFGVYGADQRGVHPVTFIGWEQGADAFLVNVLAHDQQGVIVSSSAGLYFGQGVDPAAVIDNKNREVQPVQQLFIDRQYDLAVNRLQERLDQDPNDLFALDALARVYFAGTHQPELGADMAHQNLEKSRAMLERLVDLNPTAEHYAGLALVNRSLQDEAGALAAYEAMIEQGFADWRAYTYLADHHLDQEDDYLLALELFGKAEAALASTRLTDGFIYSSHGHAALLLLTGQPEQAATVIRSSPTQHMRAWTELLALALEEYNRSDWHQQAQGLYLPDVSGSFAEAKQQWQEGEGALAAFLYTIAEMTDVHHFRRRDVLVQAVEQFKRDQAEIAPVLLEVIEGLGRYMHL